MRCFTKRGETHLERVGVDCSVKVRVRMPALVPSATNGCADQAWNGRLISIGLEQACGTAQPGPRHTRSSALRSWGGCKTAAR